jgi:hypothetical protein
MNKIQLQVKMQIQPVLLYSSRNVDVKTLILVLNILIVEGKIYMALDTRKLYYVHLLVIVLILEGQEYRYIDSPI